MDTSSGSSPSQEAREVADRLHSSAIHLLRRVRVSDAELGLSAPRLSALSVVVFAGPVTIGELAAAEQVRPPTMTRLVDGLAHEGLVTREPHPRDGRSVLVRATAMGQLVLTRGRSRRIDELETRVGSLTQDEITKLSEAAVLMERIAGMDPERTEGERSQ